MPLVSTGYRDWNFISYSLRFLCAMLAASLIAQKLDAFTATRCTALINGAVGDELFETKGCGFIASDLAE